MTLYLSYDEGGTWEHALQLNDGMAAYSDLVKVDGTHVGVLYEASDYDEIVYSSVVITVPEPGTLALLACGLLGLLAYACRKRK